MGLIRLARGQRFANDFEVVSVVAEGGMGTVYAVHDHAANERRALKLLLPELIADEKSRRRFTQEAQVASAIESPHVPQVFRGGIDPHTATPYIVMELLEGENLGVRIKRGPVPAPVTLTIFEQLTHALEAAHRAGIVHRDLKPENVYLSRDPDGELFVKLLDFGVAKLIDAHRTSATGTGAVGSPMWMAPEQTSAGGRIAPSTDIWALGLMAFYALTGKMFWEAASGHTGVTGLLREIHLDPIPKPTDRAQMLGVKVALPNGFDTWFENAVNRDQKRRFHDAGAAMAALRPVLRPEISRSSVAYASTLAFHAPKPPEEAGFDAAATTPFEAPSIPETHSPDGESLPPVAPASPRALASDPVPETRGPDDPGNGLRPVVESSPAQPAFTPPSRPAPAPASTQRGGISPIVWVILLLFAGLAVSFLAALVVWVVLTLSTP